MKYYGCDMIGQRTDSETVAKVFPNKFALMLVEEESDLGVSIGKLLCVANSLKRLSKFIDNNKEYENKLLHYITGSNLFY